MGRNPDEAEIFDTWDRRVPSMLKTLTEGMRSEAKPVMRTFDADTDTLIVKTGIPLYSLCGHHILPFYGVAHVAYQPNDEMVGLSKLIRYVRWQSRRLTTQEELSQDIATGLAEELDAQGVIVELTATHMCEAMRGVETVTETTTREHAGTVTEADRKQFCELIQRNGASIDAGY
jgi:GTP cyclohydrolase I